MTVEPESESPSDEPTATETNESPPVEITPLDSEPEPVVGPGPVTAQERVIAVDTIRGFALLGILAMNIVGFGWPDIKYENPTFGTDFSGISRAIWTFNAFVFHEKMMTLFSMLFGAGLVLMGERAKAQGRSFLGFYYRRIFWLLVIGCIHAYLIWDGDVLVFYAECGLFLYPLRKLSGRILVGIGVLLLLVFMLTFLGFVSGVRWIESNAAEAEAAEKAGQPLTDTQKTFRELWKEIGPEFFPTEAKQQEEYKESLEVHRGGYLGIVADRAPKLFQEHTFLFLIFIWSVIGGRMVLGMGLMKFGVFSGTRSRSFYLALMLIGYGIGETFVALHVRAAVQGRFTPEWRASTAFLLNEFGSILVALGHASLIILLLKAGVFPGLLSRLAAVGRMALTNYLTHSIVCTTLFYGYGFGLFGKVHRGGLALIVLAIWTFQLIVSPIWLRHFRFGPAEWLWRSLTYWKPQPMLVRKTALDDPLS